MTKVHKNIKTQMSYYYQSALCMHTKKKQTNLRTINYYDRKFDELDKLALHNNVTIYI